MILLWATRVVGLLRAPLRYGSLPQKNGCGKGTIPAHPCRGNRKNKRKNQLLALITREGLQWKSSAVPQTCGTEIGTKSLARQPAGTPKYKTFEIK